MHLAGTNLRLSPSDLSGFLGCRHRTGLDLAVAHGLLPKPVQTDAVLDAMRRRGAEHEQAYVDSLRANGLAVVAIDPNGDIPTRAAATLQAMHDGAEVIVQATLVSDEPSTPGTPSTLGTRGTLGTLGTWLGYADVLRRVNRPSILGAWSYEPVDTKLARETRGGTILQLAVYADLLEQLQGLCPDHFHVVTPGTNGAAFIEHAYRFNDYAAYYRVVRAQLAETIALGHEAIRDRHYPEPVKHCDVCRWSDRCTGRRRADDHLSFIAGIGRLHRDELTAHGVPTLAAAAAMPLPIAFTPARGSRDTYTRFREQARLQHQQRTTKQSVHELLPVADGQGLARLPEPSPGDLFLDLEGARFAREGGREYLFGVWSRATPAEPVESVESAESPTRLPAHPPTCPSYVAAWAFDDDQERAAFESVIDRIMTTWAANPTMHVYHFGHYEPTAFKRLMGRYATRGEELDRLLRAERFVDLFAVVRQALRAGVESYSIKQLEQFYSFTREVALHDASTHLQAIELALESGAPTAIADDVRAAVQGYNRDDCHSTEALRDWLETLRSKAIVDGANIPRPVPEDAGAPEAIGALEQRQSAVRERLLASIPAEASAPGHEQHPQWLLAYLIDWHRREDKSAWWEYYRLRDLAEEDFIEETQAISGLEHVERLDQTHYKNGNLKSALDRYRFPLQETELRRGAKLRMPGGDRIGDIAAIDRTGYTVDIQKGKNGDVHPRAVYESEVISTTVQQEALLRFAEAMPDVSCGMDLLFRRTPRLQGASPEGPGCRNPEGPGFGDPEGPGFSPGNTGELGEPEGPGFSPGNTGGLSPLEGETTADFAVRLATALHRTTLAIQGPPGSGKTYVGAQMIRALVAAGKRVGVTAVSHKVIRNLLDSVSAVGAGLQTGPHHAIRLGHKCDPNGDDHAGGGAAVTEFGDNASALSALATGEIDVLGATSWLWSREDATQTVDVLFVDEAGQMSLANALAVSGAANSLVLLGDPQQLDQPQKGTHPDGVGVSAIEHVLAGEKTMPSDRGLFLPTTWRLHPSICAFTSELFYEGKLQSREGLERQRLTDAGDFDGAGLWWVPVAHEGNQNYSPEEVDVVARIVDQLLGNTRGELSLGAEASAKAAAPPAQWIDADGCAHPLTPEDIRIVAPFNAHVNRIAERLVGYGVPFGTVDKFQGQEAPFVIYSMATSRAEDAPRGMEFLYSLNRLNVATSRARCVAIVVASPRLAEPPCRTPRQMTLANALCRFLERSMILTELGRLSTSPAPADEAEIVGVNGH